MSEIEIIEKFLMSFYSGDVGKPRNMYIADYQLMMTCSGYPEQYDVYKDGEQVGYLRLRHGSFTAQYPDYGGECLYEAYTGYGEFDNDKDRSIHLTRAIIAIDRKVPHLGTGGQDDE